MRTSVIDVPVLRVAVMALVAATLAAACRSQGASAAHRALLLGRMTTCAEQALSVTDDRGRRVIRSDTSQDRAARHIRTCAAGDGYTCDDRGCRAAAVPGIEVRYDEAVRAALDDLRSNAGKYR